MGEDEQHKVDFEVKGRLRDIRQLGELDCWATVATILCSWKNDADETKEDVLTKAGDRFLSLFQEGKGLHHTDLPAFLDALHLSMEPPMSFSVDGLDQLLRSHGLLWITTDEDSGPNFSTHARVLFGLRGDGSPENTSAFFLDPDRGRITETVAELQEKLIQLAIGDIRFGGETARIIHF